MTSVSRDILRAVLETRDRRHSETHAILLTMVQGIVTELIEQGALSPAPLADRLALGRPAIEPDPHGTTARDMLDHMVGWLRAMQPGLPPSHPARWIAPSGGVERPLTPPPGLPKPPPRATKAPHHAFSRFYGGWP